MAAIFSWPQCVYSLEIEGHEGEFVWVAMEDNVIIPHAIAYKEKMLIHDQTYF